jgi:CBS domain-containing protein
MMPIAPDLVAGPEDAMSDALDKLSRSSVQRLLVTHDGRLPGIISHADASLWLDRERLREELSR